MTDEYGGTASRRFASGADQIREARRFVQRVLEGRGLSARVNDVVLMASELVTNAVTYGRGGIDVSIVASDGRVRVEVVNVSADHSTPHLVTPGPGDIGGRGIGIVDQLATLWGTERRHDGRIRVWFELDQA